MSLNYVKDLAYCTAIGISQNANAINTGSITMATGTSSCAVSSLLTASNVVIFTPTSINPTATLFWVVQTVGTGFTIYANANATVSAVTFKFLIL